MATKKADRNPVGLESGFTPLWGDFSQSDRLVNQVEINLVASGL